VIHHWVLWGKLLFELISVILAGLQCCLLGVLIKRSARPRKKTAKPELLEILETEFSLDEFLQEDLSAYDHESGYLAEQSVQSKLKKIIEKFRKS